MAAPARILVLNHRRDDLASLCDAAARVGHEVGHASSLQETRELLDREMPDLVLLNPLVVEAGCVELELVEALQRPGAPVPVVIAVDDPRAFDRSATQALPIRDFVTRPIAIEECLQRFALALQTRNHMVTLHERALELEGQVSIDFKTDLLSERYFNQLLQLEFKRARRHRTQLSLALIDVDNFKSINDSTVYAFGDEVLKHVAQCLKSNIRETDFAARFGGDEFVLLLPHTSASEAVHTATRIRNKIAESVVRWGEYERSVTISVGIDTFDGIRDGHAADLRRHANLALQQSKRRGKDKVWLYEQISRENPGESAGA